MNNWFEKSSAEVNVCKIYCSRNSEVFLDLILVLKKIYSIDSSFKKKV